MGTKLDSDEGPPRKDEIKTLTLEVIFPKKVCLNALNARKSRKLKRKSGNGKKGEINLTEFSNLEVTVFHNDLEQAIRVLKKKLDNDGLFRRLKAKRSYEKPSECRRRKRRESERRRRINRLKGSRYSK